MMDESVTIRPMTGDDLDWIVAVERTVFSDPWPKSAFLESLRFTGGLNVVAAVDDTLCGYLCAQVVADEIQIHNIAVAPTARRRGIARQLMDFAEAHGVEEGAVCAVLEVRTTNKTAIQMYTNRGYQSIGRRRGYYRRPLCDALVLMKVLDDSDPGDREMAETTDGMVS
ncbi:MAG: ribosomal protein S18-alanine N-acetyltransferase [Candidatus Zixiibacteriota bacterium]